MEVKHYNSWEEETSYAKNLLTHGSLKQGFFVGIQHLYRLTGFSDLQVWKGILVALFEGRVLLFLAAHNRRISKLFWI